MWPLPLCQTMEAAALDKWTKGSIQNMKGSYSFAVYGTQFCACHLPNPIPTPEARAQIYTENKWDQANGPFEKLPSSFYKAFVCDLWQNLLASENTQTLCARCYWKSRQQHSSYSSFYSCVLLRAAEPEDVVCVTNPVSQARKQDCSGFGSAAIPVWPDYVWTKPRASQ